ncbi:small nuclear ribonucleoprotein F, putative [Babesia bigemina]|uniref:Small nuclear ribonucleoprotein F, putative n=1 Tax=Babesia bigemina TaxID=5866 RepID=A0A061D4Y2_BABBI|nr:small nuclear ribonucleoprotein F, putative [Babesia bigemina]CDR95751.1 small nuclear ribonucleoprotein F, putative [Babesia bigemina]|eukprot:XP_012767937.1 small nuclear ribonucleoprotein F, putative [Babesia bigemina]
MRSGWPTAQPEALPLQAGGAERHGEAEMGDGIQGLVAVTAYMNIELDGAEEWENGVLKGKLGGNILIRCNNMLYIRAADPTSA